MAQYTIPPLNLSLCVKVFQVDVREQAAASLWALAGQTLKQQKLMAEQMGIPLILDLLLSSSDKMQYVGTASYIFAVIKHAPGRDRPVLFPHQAHLSHS